MGAEPGYYTDSEYGIGIANMVVVREVQTPTNFSDKAFLRFEHVTMVSFFFASPPLTFGHRDDMDLARCRGTTLLTCYPFSSTSAGGWMRIIGR